MTELENSLINRVKELDREVIDLESKLIEAKKKQIHIWIDEWSEDGDYCVVVSNIDWKKTVEDFIFKKIKN